MLDLKYLNAYEIGNLVRSKKITPTEVITYFKERIEKLNPYINAFTYTNFDYAYKKAKELEKKIKDGCKLGVFAGVPFALKDFLSSKQGWPCTHGGVECLKDIDEYSSVFCKAMEKEDGIAIGKTNAPAYGFRGTTDNVMFGPTRNPFNLNKNSGGSSGGSAAAVAAGMVPIAEGGDAGGSIRIPASWCNLVGFKATNNYIPNVCYPDAFSATHPFCTCGGEVKSVRDSWLLFKAMNQYTLDDPQSLPFKSVRKKKLVLGFTYDFNIYQTSGEIKKSLGEFIYKVSKENSDIDVIPIEFSFKHNLKEVAEMWCKMISVDTTIGLELDKRKGFDLENNYRDDVPEEFIYYANEVRRMNFMDYYEYNLIRSDIYRNFKQAFDKCDIILSPVTSCMPVNNTSNKNTLGPSDIEPLIGWSETFMVNFIGNPAMSVPMNLIDNLPAGLQLIGRKGEDSLLFNLARKIEKMIKWKDWYCLSMKDSIE